MLHSLIDVISYGAVRMLVGFINLFPLGVRLFVIERIIRLGLVFSPRHRRIAFRNLEFAFPDKPPEWHRETFDRSVRAFSRIFVDLIRMHTLDRRWVERHVECPYLEEYRRTKTGDESAGIIFATGHLGSFEVLAHCVPLYGFPISFVVRSFNLPRINRWWKSKREALGNRVIDRKGAFQAVMNDLTAGRDVGILFDQNVTRNHAVFVEFFGRATATTKMVGIAALRTRAKVLVVSIAHRGDDHYRIDVVPCDFTAIYDDPALSNEEKIRRITQQVSTEYERMIRENPGEWFWMHRRWKTTPEGVPEDFYR